MWLKVTVALGNIPFRNSRQANLEKVLVELHPEVEPEAAEADSGGKWSYTFTINVDSLPTLVRVLHQNGRFKILKAFDLERGVELKMRPKRRRNRRNRKT
jgi:hypothetical protein